MDVKLVIAFILICAAIVVFVVRKRSSLPDVVLRYLPWGLLSAGVIVFALSCFTVVPANTVSFANSFGRPTDVYSNGWNPKAPWAETVNFDGSRQFLPFEGHGDPEKHIFPCVNVRLSNNAGACLSGIVEWQMLVITPEQRARALDLYRQYKSFDRLRDNYMLQRVQTALGKVFADHNPLIPDKNLTLAQLNTAATAALKDAVGDTVTVYAVTLGVPDYDETTDAAIAKQQAEYANTATAAQKVLTATQEALAASKLQLALKDSPEYTTNKCLDIAREAINRGQAVEPGLCMGGSNVLLNRK